MNTTVKVEVIDQPVVRLMIELPAKYADELGGLLANHVDWQDFPWAGEICKALERAGIRRADVFRDEQLGWYAFLQRKQGTDEEDE